MNLKKYWQITTRLPRYVVSYYSGFRITPKPWVLYFEITYKCNSRCIYCDRWRTGITDKRKELSTDEVKTLVDEAKKLGVTSIILTGGEPLLRKDIYEIGEYIKDKGLRCKLLSNGYMINNDNIDKISKSFDSVSVSLDSLDPNIHNSNRGVENSFDQVMNAIKLLKQNKIKYSFETVITKDNYKDIPELQDFAKRMGCYLAMNPANDLIDTQERIRDKNIIKFDFEKFKREWAEIMKKFEYSSGFNKFSFQDYYDKFPDYIENPSSVKENFICFAGSYNIYIDPYGDVFGCETIRKSMGNIKEKSLKKIWKNMKGFRRKVSSNKRDCHCWYGCTAKDFIFLTKVIIPFRKCKR